MQKNVGAVGTGSSQNTVSNLDFELRKVREFQNSSRGVTAEAITPPALQPTFLHPETNAFVIFNTIQLTNSIKSAVLFEIEYNQKG
ncbi:hypothetical protein [Companilactobacillus zhachilii]|uniref:hypothetical protein n=1 Tax=Companilactobacillus zhachilii TaxID=2304606 RepID=UPI000E720228|nr:hypothetical protein [Companilactobacillus zhachilii]